ncbi:hypothetical protein V6N13_036505 [Hibiscus sabdariffa]
MDVMCRTGSVLKLIGGVVNKAVSFLVFSVLDLVDFILCFAYKVADFCIEAEWRPCYCSPTKETITGSGGKILVSEQGGSKIVSLNSSKVQLEDISDTLYSRPSLVAEVSKLTVDELKKLKLDGTTMRTCKKIKKGSARSAFTVNSIVVEMLQGKMVGQRLHHIPTWSDCDCKFCNSWTSSSKDTLFVKAQEPKDNKAREDVIFIHGFISSSAFWTETLFPNFSSTAKSTYRFLAVDLLGFGRSPKPADSLYTLREHVDMIEKSVLQDYKVKSFHIVAHSLGCILALAIAVKHPGSVKSLTLLTPVNFFSFSQLSVQRLPINRKYHPCISAAILSGTKGRSSDTICYEKISSTTSVAGDGVLFISGLLVRAHQQDDLPRHMQEPSAVGISHQTCHQKQVT